MQLKYNQLRQFLNLTYVHSIPLVMKLLNINRMYCSIFTLLPLLGAAQVVQSKQNACESKCLAEIYHRMF
jgi:hypothetical protein